MSLRTTLVLAVLCALVVLLTHLSERDRLTWLQQDSDQPFGMTVDSIVELRIERDGETFLCRREGEWWEIREPIVFPAHHPLMERFLYQLRELRVRSDVGADPDRFGLGESRLVVSFRTRGGRAETVRFGQDHPSLPFVYLALGNQVVLSDPGLRDLYREFTLEELRDNTICAISSARAGSVTITPTDNAGQRLTLVREDTWRIVEPFAAEADVGEARNLVDVLNSWGIEEYVEDHLAPADRPRFGLDAPRYRIDVVDREGESRVGLEIGGSVEGSTDPPRVYVAWAGRPFVFAASAAPLALLARSPETYRNRLLLRLPEPEIEGISVVDPFGAKCSVEPRESGGWSLLTGQSSRRLPVDADWFARWTEALRATEVDRFISPDMENLQEYGLDRPSRLLIRPRRGEPEELWVGREHPDRPGLFYLWNRRWRDQWALGELPGSEAILEAPWSLRSTRLLDLGEDELRRFTLELDTGKSATFERPASQWRRRGSPDEQLVESEMARIVNAVTEMTALRWEPEPSSPPGPGNFALYIEVSPVPGQDFERRTFWVGPPLADRQRLVRDGQDGWVARIRSLGEIDLLEFSRRFVEELAD